MAAATSRRCYCFVPKCDFMEPCGSSGCEVIPCPEKPLGEFDFCVFHLVTYNTRTRNIRVGEDRVRYVAPVSGKTIMDDTWFRKNERYFRGYETKLMPGCSYTWIFVYHMVKRIEKKLKRFDMYWAASRIQRYYKRAISDPSYKMCRERLLREFGDFETTQNAKSN